MPALIEISDRQRTRLGGYLREHLHRALPLIELSALDEISIALVDAPTMADLHWQFMQRRGPTDVLTFALAHDGRNRVTSGEIVICVPYARRQSAANGVPLRRELLLYCLHGILHLSGYDDTTQRGFNAMHEAEDMILTQLSVGPTFYPPEKPAARPTARPNRRRNVHQ